MRHGHIKISRKMFDGNDELWSDGSEFDRRSAWIDLIQVAAFRNHKKLIGNQFLTLQRGELLGSLRFLGERWGWGRDRVSLFLGLLEEMGRIQTVRRTPHGTVYLVVKYEEYQNVPDAVSDRASDADPTGTRQVPDKENKGSTRSTGTKTLDQTQDQNLAVGSADADPVAVALVPHSVANGHGTPSPGRIAQALVARCCAVHTEAGVEVTKRDRGQWAGIAKRVARDRSFEQIAFAVAGMDRGGGKLWRFNAENPDRVPWSLFQLEQFFTMAVAAGRVRVEGPQRAEDDFDERVRRRAESLK